MKRIDVLRTLLTVVRDLGAESRSARKQADKQLSLCRRELQIAFVSETDGPPQIPQIVRLLDTREKLLHGELDERQTWVREAEQLVSAALSELAGDDGTPNP